MGGGQVLYSKSSTQKINTKSSTEAEMVPTSDTTRHILWTVYDLKSQGYHVKENMLYQDNLSVIL